MRLINIQVMCKFRWMNWDQLFNTRRSIRYFHFLFFFHLLFQLFGVCSPSFPLNSIFHIFIYTIHTFNHLFFDILLFHFPSTYISFLILMFLPLLIRIHKAFKLLFRIYTSSVLIFILYFLVIPHIHLNILIFATFIFLSTAQYSELYNNCLIQFTF